MASLINTQNVKILAKQFGKNLTDIDYQVSKEFVDQVEELFENVIKYNVLMQDSMHKKTLKATDWAAETKKVGKEFVSRYE